MNGSAQLVEQRRAAPAIFIVGKDGSLHSSTPEGEQVWSAIAASVPVLLSQMHHASPTERSSRFVIAGRYEVRLSPLSEHDRFVVLAELFRTRDPLRDISKRFPLTRREREVVRLLIAGATTAEIADTLSIAPSTVMLHLKSVMAKTGARSRSAVVGRLMHHDGDGRL